MLSVGESVGAHPGNGRGVALLFTTAKVHSEDQETLKARALIGATSKRNEVQMRVLADAPLNGRPDFKLNFGIAAISSDGLVFPLEFESGAEHLIDDGAANAACDHDFFGALVAKFCLKDKVQTPVPAFAKVIAQQDFTLDRITAEVVVRKGVFEIERRVAPDLSPVGERPAHLRGELIEVGVAFFMQPIVIQVELETPGQTDLDLLLETILWGTIFIGTIPPPLLESYFPWIFLDINASGAKAALLRPLRLIVSADVGVFRQTSDRSRDGHSRQSG